MVGPRSTGCRRCVSRKVKCDETRPHCNRCTRANFQCPGYSPHFQFLSLNTAQCSNCTLGNFPCVRKGSKCTRCRRENLDCDLSRAPFIPDSDPARSNLIEALTSTTTTLTPHQYNEDVYCTFFLDKFFGFEGWNEEFQSNRLWIWSALQNPSESPVSNLAVRSLTTVFFGNAHRNPELAKGALELHGQTLRGLNRTVQDNGPDISFDTLSAVFLLVLYESCHTTNPTAWLNHVSGARMLFKIKGHNYFQSRPARSLLTISRLTMATEALISRKRCFLEEQGWKEALQNGDDGYARTLQLGNLFSALPGLFEDIKNLEAMDYNDAQFPDQFKALFAALLAQFDELNDWWECYIADPQQVPQRVIIDEDLEKQLNEFYPAGIPPTALGTKSSSVLRFKTLEAASAHCKYHAHFVVLVRMANRLLHLQGHAGGINPEEFSHRNLCIRAPDETSAFPLIDTAIIIPHAHAICEVLPTYSLPQYRHTGAMHVGMPARVAWQNLPKDSPDVEWIEQFLEKMADSSGFQIPRRVLRDIKLNG